MSTDSSEPVSADSEANEEFDTGCHVAPRDPDALRDSLAGAVAAARCADDLRGTDIVVLDLTRLTSIVDFFVVITATSRRQMHAIADEIHRLLKHDLGNQRLNVEGYRTEGNWLLTDYGDIVVHIFTEDGRALYDLEQLWADARRVDWQEDV